MSKKLLSLFICALSVVANAQSVQKMPKYSQKEAGELKTDAKEVHKYTDMDFFKADIKEDFEKWSQRSEFEKKEEYDNRLATKSVFAFDSICYDAILFKVHFNNQSYAGPVGLLKYNPDLEKFGISFLYTGNPVDSVSVPIQVAKQFIFDFNQDRIISVTIELKDFCLVNNNLQPKKGLFFNRRNPDNEQFPFQMASTTQTKKIQFTPSDVGITMLANLKNAKFDYEEFAAGSYTFATQN